MSQKEDIELFEKIWSTDIINKMEPLYSVAISVTECWSRCGTSLVANLCQRLVAKWKQDLINDIKHRHLQGGCIMNMSEIKDSIAQLRIKYKDSLVILSILKDLSFDFVV